MSVTWDRSVVFSGPPLSSTNKIDRHDITEILLKVALNTITLTLTLEHKKISMVQWAGFEKFINRWTVSNWVTISTEKCRHIDKWMVYKYLHRNLKK
jgi:hypothetical protein